MSEMVDRVLDVMLSRGLMADEADARAAVEAMREPTEAMLAAGMAEAEVDLASEYRAMIDRALADE